MSIRCQVGIHHFWYSRGPQKPYGLRRICVRCARTDYYRSKDAA